MIQAEIDRLAAPFLHAAAPAPEQAQARDPTNARRPTKSAAPAQIMASHLLIEFDEASPRFAQTLFGATSMILLRRFPDETQLAFSRGLAAYVRAMRGV